MEVRAPSFVRDAALVDGVVVSDAGRRVIDVSDRFCALVGYAREELVGVCPPYPWWPGGEEPESGGAERDVLVQRKDGSCLPVLVHETVRLGADDTAVGRISTFKDISERVIRERAVQAAERQFRLVFDDAPIGMALTALTGRFVRVNRAFGEMLGFTPDELVGMSAGGFTMPQDRDRDFEQRVRMLAGELDVDRRRKRYLGSSGRVVVVDLVERLMRDEAGEAVCTIAHVEDVTARLAGELAREQAEQQLREASEQLAASERHYRLLAENSSDVVMRTAADGTIQYVSPASMALLGRTPESLVGCPISDILAPEDRDGSDERRARVDASEGTAVLEMRLLHGDGHFVWCETAIRSVRDPTDDSVTERQSSIRSIDARKRAELALRQSADQYRAVAASIPDGFVLLFDHDLRHLIAEGAGLEHLGYARDAAEGRTLRETVPPEIADALEERYRRALAGESTSWERGHRGRVLQLTAGPVRNLDGAITAGVVVAVDVTAQKRAEAGARDRDVRFRSALDASLDNFCVMDAVRDDSGAIVDFVFWEVNARFAELTGHHAAALIGTRFGELSDEAPGLVPVYAQALVEQRPIESEIQLRDGRWFAQQIVPLEDGVVFTSRDITERRRDEQELRELEAEHDALRDVATAVAEGAGADAVFLLVSQRVAELFAVTSAAVVRFDGGDQGTLLGVTPERPPTFVEGALLTLDDSTAAGRVHAGGEACLVHYDAEPMTRFFGSDVVEGAGAPIRLGGRLWGALSINTSEHGRLGQPSLARLCRFADLIALAVANTETMRRLVDDATTDTLTGLANRRAFTAALETEHARAGRTRRGVGVLLLDIDHFKQINDLHGHEVGDEVLCGLAHALSRTVRPYDLVARWGGEEFIILLGDLPGDTALRTIAEGLAHEVRETPIETRAGALRITVSIGAATRSDRSPASGAIIEAADRALYAAKRRGRDRAVLAHELTHRDNTPEVPESVRVAERLAEELATAASLREAIPAQHPAEVADLAARTAGVLGLPSEIVGRCRLGGWLHDVGKLAIPDDVLRAAADGTLDDAARAVLRTHAPVGASIIERVPTFAEAAAAIRHHHERYDGTGYPDGLCGEEIPVEARIVAAAATYSAITRERALPQESPAALGELRSAAGTALDPEVVDALELAVRLSPARGHLPIPSVSPLIR